MQIPRDLALLAEAIVFDGEPHTIKAIGQSIDTALTKAQSALPAAASLLEKKMLVRPERTVIRIEAFDETSALSQAKSQFNDDLEVEIQSVRLITEGSKGFMGIGKKPNHYDVEILPKVALVEILYKHKAKIYAMIGDLQAKKDIAHAWAQQWWKEAKIHVRTSAICDGCNRDLSIGEGCLCNPRIVSLSVLNTPDLVCEWCFDIYSYQPWGKVIATLKQDNDTVFNKLKETGHKEPGRNIIRELKNNRDVDTLIGVVDNWALQPLLRILAAQGLREIGDVKAVDKLSYILRKDFSIVEIGQRGGILCEIARALGRMGDPQAIEPLAATLDDAYKEYRREERLAFFLVYCTAATALGKLGDKRGIDVIYQQYKNFSSSEVVTGTEVLLDLGESKGIELVREAYREKEFHREFIDKVLEKRPSEIREFVTGAGRTLSK